MRYKSHLTHKHTQAHAHAHTHTQYTHNFKKPGTYRPVAGTCHQQSTRVIIINAY